MTSPVTNISTVPDLISTGITLSERNSFGRNSIAEPDQDNDLNINRNYNKNDRRNIMNLGNQKSNINNSTSSQNKIPQFEAKTQNIHLLHKLINSVESFGNFGSLEISSDGICFSISDGNISKIRLNLNKKVFDEFTFNGLWRKAEYTDSDLYADDTDLSNNEDDDDDEEGNGDNYVVNGFDKDAVIIIQINLTSFLETINIHVREKKNMDTDVTCTFRYERDGDPFLIIFEDESIVEKCELNTYYTEDQAKKQKGKRKKKANQKQNNNHINSEVFDEENELALKMIDNMMDDSIFRLDSTKILFDIILKANILHDTIKDMNDLSTEKFILYCRKTKSNEFLNGINNESTNIKNNELIFISKSKSDTIGFSKLIIPQRKTNIPLFNLFKPVLTTSSENEYEFNDCNDLSLSSTYHFENFSKLLKAIKLSKMIKIRKDMNGITSLLLLLGKTEYNQQQELNGLYGSSIEFVTLESIPFNELFTINNENVNVSLLGKLGYENKFVEQIIKDDRDIQTIRIGNDGQLITLDDFFGNVGAEFEQIENHNHSNINNFSNIHNDVEYIPIEKINEKKNISKKDREREKESDKNILKLTEQLTMSLLGHPIPVGGESDNGDIEVEKTMFEDGESDNENNNVRRRKRASNDINKRSRIPNKKTKSKKKDDKSGNGNGIETVGGAIEIPLFI